MEIKEITPEADKRIAELVRENLEKFHLDIPGTVYFDPELDNLSAYYLSHPDTSKYFVLWDGDEVCGGAGFSKFDEYEDCVELQKLYLCEDKKGQGLGKKLFLYAEDEARKMGFKRAYIETHTNLDLALQMYYRMGYKQIENPLNVNHGSMNRFLIKEL